MMGCRTRLLTAVLLGMAASAHARKEIGRAVLEASSGTGIEIQSIFDPPPPSGYAPLRVIAMNGTDKDTRWSLDFSCSTQQYRSSNRHSSEFTLEVAPHATQSTLILAPMPVSYGDSGYGNNFLQMQIALSVDGIGTRDFYENVERADGFPAIAISKALADGGINRLEDELESRLKSASRGGGDSVFGSRFDPGDLPEDWRGLSGFDVLMVSHIEWLALKPGARLATEQWVRLGGRLHLYMGPGASAASLDLPKDALEGRKIMSLGTITLLSWDGKSLPASETVERYWHSKQREKELTDAHTGLSAGKPAWTLLKALGERSFASWQVLVFLVVFGILVGPVNLFVLAPASRRHRLFVTTPLLSLGASAIMVVILLVQDGVGGSGKRFVAVNLEPAETTAFVTQEQVCRTGLLTSSGFENKHALLIEPLALPDKPWVKLKNTYGSQSTELRQNGNEFSGNFFQSRAEQGQLLTATLPTRARLELKAGLPQGAPPELISALGFTAQEVFYVDAAGTVWKTTAPLTTGQAGKTEKSDLAALRTWWNQACKPAGMRTQERLEQQLTTPRDVFFAKAEQAPDFVLHTLNSIRWHDDQVVIFGSVPKP